MPTVLSWTELRAGGADLRALLAFRGSSLDRRLRRRLRIGVGLVVGLTLASVVVPAYARQALDERRSGEVLTLLPASYLGFLVLAVLSAAAAGGGREVVPRDQAVAFPVSPVTDHLGALLLAPLNIAWLIQGWTILGATTYVLGPRNLPATAVPLLVWLFTATALAQAIGWLIEWIRRGVHGIAIVRGLSGLGLLVVGALTLTHSLTRVAKHSPTHRILLVARDGSTGSWGWWLLGTVVLLTIGVASLVLGAVPARMALQRAQREELRLEAGHVAPRPDAGSDLVALLRTDRSTIWRAVPLRRGLLVLALMPGLVAFAGQLEWSSLTILPGLVATGGALLFGVNAWCLDGRGALWRESLPVSPRLVFWARSLVLAEVLLASALVTLLLGALRAGVPTASEVSALVCATLVVSVQVVSTSMRWSVRRPYAVDLRSARAAPAPPLAMAGYSARLAAWTTFSGLVFSGLASLDDPAYAVIVALPMLGWSSWRLRRAANQWTAPATRARVIGTVAS